MRAREWAFVLLLIVACALPIRMAAPGQMTHYRHYSLFDLGRFAGPQGLESGGFFAYAKTLNNHGTVAWESETSVPDANETTCFTGSHTGDCLVQHPFKLQDGILTDLGALPGSNSSLVQWISESESIAGASEGAITDPLTGLPELEAVLWRDGKIVPLGKLSGGGNSFAVSLNNRDQVVGWATNTIPDTLGRARFNILGKQMRPFLWQHGEMLDLGTLGGPDATALAVNERGQVVGISLTSSAINPATGQPTQDPFFWENGRMVNIGNLGGVYSEAHALNERGQVIGQSSVAENPGACFVGPSESGCHAFLWENGKLLDLTEQTGGTFVTANSINDYGEIGGIGDFSTIGGSSREGALWNNGVVTHLASPGGACCSAVLAINNKGQAVGSAGLAAVLWERGSAIDLNTVIPPGASLRLDLAHNINDHGEIAGSGVLSNGDKHAFLLVPVCEDNSKGCEDAPLDSTYIIHSRSAPHTEGSMAAPSQPSLTPEEFMGRLRAQQVHRNRGFVPMGQPQQGGHPLSAPVYGYKIIKTYPHDPQAFTEGLIYLDGFLYESTGITSESSVRKVDLTTGKLLKFHKVPNQYFGEGLTNWGNTLVQLTFQTNIGFVYDLSTFNQINSFSYPEQGWGLTQDGAQLIRSDGTCNLHFFDPITFQQTNQVCVTDGPNPVTNINELEYIKGRIFANIYGTELIAVIWPGTGKVTAWIDCTGLRPPGSKFNVMNGIAYDPQLGRIFITGKWWPNLYWIQYVHR